MRKMAVFALLALLLTSAWKLGAFPLKDAPWSQGRMGDYWELTLKPFLSAAAHPTLTDQSQSLPEGATPFYVRLLSELGATVRYALIAMSLAVPAGLIFGFLASTAWWPSGTGSRGVKLVAAPINFIVRLLMTLMRSIHELIWAIIFLIALGDEPLTACVALALPFAGTLGKVFSEILDEQLPQARKQLQASGASGIQAFLTSLLPQSLPNMATYSLYRFECALRSSAVLGFIGIETIGLSINRSFENIFYREVWTELYLLLAVIVLVDVIGAKVRHRLHTIPERKKPIVLDENASRSEKLSLLKKSAPYWKLPRVVAITLCITTVVAWLPSLAFIDSRPLTGNSSRSLSWERADSFITDITPEPMRDGGDWHDVAIWANQLWAEKGQEALTNTVAMATTAIILAALAAVFIIPWASRSLTRAKPLGLPGGKISAQKNAVWKGVGFTTRSGFIVSRAVPEYIYAYILIGLLGVSAWPLVIALALHNFGILGRLWGEVLENEPDDNARQLVGTGAGRFQCYLASLLPVSFNRFLMYLFYRWETCVREATVLGMLGVASLGMQIDHARNFYRAYDEMFFYVLIGAAVILIGDFISVAMRGVLRRA